MIFNNKYVFMSLLAGLFTFSLTALGSSIVFFFKKVNKNIMDNLLGFSAGVMLSASFFSLLSPALIQANNLGMKDYLVLSIGFLFGGIFLIITDKIFNKDKKDNHLLLLVSSITLHNIPEGLSLGVAFGSLIYSIEGINLSSAITLMIGIGIQNFPEGSAVSLPLRRGGYSRFKAFFIGALSAIVEPISALVGAILVTKVQYILPFLLSFAAGAMINVSISELVPEALKNKNKNMIIISILIGFTIMLVLDVALG